MLHKSCRAHKLVGWQKLQTTQFAAFNSEHNGGRRHVSTMDDNFTLLWIGKRHQSPEIAAGIQKAGYRVINTSDVPTTMETLRKDPIDLIVLENETSCVQGELAAVRLKSAAPRVPILLLCDPVQSGTPQVFFVNMIVALRSGPELLMRAIETLLPSESSRRTAS
jgi:hypothetical protein